MASGLVGGLFAQSITTTITGKLGPITSGSGAVVGGTYVSGLTAVGSSGQTCELSITGAGSGATATVALNNTNSIGANTALKMIDWGTGYSTAPTQAVAISGGTASSCSGTATITSTTNDPLDLNNQSFTATISGLEAAGVTYNPSSITYSGVSLTLTAGTVSLNPACSTASVTIAVPSASANDTLSLSNCTITGLVSGQFSSVISLPAGSIPAPIPMAFHAGVVNSPDTASTATYTLDTSDSPPATTTLGITGGVTATCVSCPSMTLSPAAGSTITLNAITGGTPTPVPVTVTTGGTVLAYAVTTNSTGGWLKVNNASTTGGSTGGSFSVSATAQSAPGTYMGTLTVFTAASNSPETINVSYVVANPTFTLNPSPTSFTFNYVTGGTTPTGALSATTTPSYSLPYTASVTSGSPWLGVSPTSGTTGSGSLTVSASPSQVSGGSYSGNIQLAATGETNGPVNVPVTFNYTQVATSNLSFSGTVGASNPATQPLVVTSTASLPSVNYTATVASGSWLSVSSGTFTTNGASPTVSVNISGLNATTYTGTINVVPTGGGVIPVTVTLTLAGAPTLSSSPTSLTFTDTNNVLPGSQTLTLSSSAGAALPINYNVTTSSSNGWLSATPASGSTNSGSNVVTVSINSNALSLNAGSYTGTVIFTPTNNTSTPVLNVTVTLVVAATLQPSPTSLTFNYTIGGTTPAAQPISVTSSGAPIAFNASATTSSGGNWLSVTPGTATTPTSLSVSVNTSGLAASTTPYTGTITLTSSAAATQIVSVSLTVNAQPVLTVGTTLLTFAGQTGGSNPASQLVAVNTSGGSLPFTASASSTGLWLSVSPTSGNTNSNLTVSVNIAGLAANTYNGSITVNVPGASPSSATINVQLTVGADVLSTLPAQLTFTYQLGGTAPSAQTLAVNTTTQGSSFTVAPGPNSTWLSVTPTSGTTGSTALTVSVNTTGLTAQTYNGSVVITDSAASNSPVSVPVMLVVSAASPLTANPTSLSFTYQSGGTAPASQTVSLVSGTEAISFTAAATTTSGGSWLAISPTSGTTPQSITVSMQNYSTLAPGVYNGSITVTPSVSNTVTIPVTLTVSSLAVTPSSLSFSYTTGAAAPAGQSIAISTPDASSVAFTATTATTGGGNWLQVSAKSGTAPASLMVTIATTGLTAGTFNGTVTIAATGYATQTVAVTLTVTQPKATIQISGSLDFAMPNTASPATNTLTVSASDGSAQPFSVAISGTNTGWLTVTPASGTTPGNVKITANPSGLIPGIYVAQFTVTEAALPIPTKTVTAQLTVTGSNLTATPNTLTFTYQPGTTIPAAQTVALALASGTGTIPLTGVSTDVSWLKATLTGTSAPTTLSVSINPGLLTAGTYTGYVLINGQGSPGSALQIPVTLTVNALPALTATPTALTFSYQIGGAVPAAQSFALAAGATVLNYTATSPGSWVQLSPARGTTPGSVMVTVDPTGLAAGTYTGTISATAIGANNPVSVTVTLTITGGTQPLTITASHLFFVAATGGTAPASQMLTVNSTSSTPVSFTASSPVPWLTVSPASGTTPAALTVAVNPTGMASGTYSSSINVTASGAAAQSVAVTLQVTSSTSIPTISGIINAASGVTGKVSPGMAISIFGTNLGPQTGVVFAAPADGGAIATTLGGTQVTFDGTAVPLLYSQSGQVNAIVPFEVANKASTEIQVTYNSQSSTGMTLTVVAAEPGLFTANNSGSGQGAILNQDYSVNSTSNPAAAGTAIMIFGTGGGQTNPPSVDGELNPNTSTGALVATATVSVNGQQQTPLYAGPAPDLLSGIIQVNAMIPDGTPSGPIPVIVTIGGLASQTVTVAVK